MPTPVIRGDFPKKAIFELRMSGVTLQRKRGDGDEISGKHQGTFQGWEVRITLQELS